MDTRSSSPLKTTLAIAVACAIGSATAFAQTGAEYPDTIPPGGSIGGGSSIRAPIPSGSGASKTTVIPYDEPGGDEAVPVTTTHHRTVRRTQSVPEDTSAVEPAQGHLRL